LLLLQHFDFLRNRAKKCPNRLLLIVA